MKLTKEQQEAIAQEVFDAMTNYSHPYRAEVFAKTPDDSISFYANWDRDDFTNYEGYFYDMETEETAAGYDEDEQEVNYIVEDLVYEYNSRDKLDDYLFWGQDYD